MLPVPILSYARWLRSNCCVSHARYLKVQINQLAQSKKKCGRKIPLKLNLKERRILICRVFVVIISMRTSYATEAYLGFEIKFICKIISINW